MEHLIIVVVMAGSPGETSCRIVHPDALATAWEIRDGFAYGEILGPRLDQLAEEGWRLLTASSIQNSTHYVLGREKPR